MPDDLALWIAVGAGAVAVIALALAAATMVRLHRVRAEQRVLLPDGAREDLISRQAALQRAVDTVERGIRDLDDVTRRQLEATQVGLESSLRFQGLVRYDAYSEMGGQQSWSIALLDAHGTGAVISCLHARDHARIYMKEVDAGVAGQRLSPEEDRALRIARGDPQGEAAVPPPPPASPDPASPALAAERRPQAAE